MADEPRQPLPQDELMTRLGRLSQQGKVDPYTMLKARLDVVTELLVPESLGPTLAYRWDLFLTELVEGLESTLEVATSMPKGLEVAK